MKTSWLVWRFGLVALAALSACGLGRNKAESAIINACPPVSTPYLDSLQLDFDKCIKTKFGIGSKMSDLRLYTSANDFVAWRIEQSSGVTSVEYIWSKNIGEKDAILKRNIIVDEKNDRIINIESYFSKYENLPDLHTRNYNLAGQVK